MATERLQKIIANSGICSRRAAEELLLKGKVSVNGTYIHELGIKADAHVDKIVVDGRILPKPQSLTYLLYKPKGVVSSTKKQKNEKIVTELVPKSPTVYPVGRLDKDSEGLLLLTNNGELANTLSHPSHGHTKTYFVKTRWQDKTKTYTSEEIVKKLLKGVKLGDGLAKADKVEIEAKEGGFELIITVREGRNHLIRRMCATVGLDVLLLRRIRLAHLVLGSLKSGQYRLLSNHEVTTLL